MSFIKDMIESFMPVPESVNAKFRDHVKETKGDSVSLKKKWETPMRPEGFWRNGMLTASHEHSKLPSQRGNGYVTIGIDSRGQALSAHSYDTALAFMDAQYKREMAKEAELAAERAAEN